MPVNRHADYLEILTRDVAGTRSFFEAVFGWAFEDYGPHYQAFTRASAGIDGGFTTGEPAGGCVLVVLYADDLEETHERVLAAGGEITKDVFDFPGGMRFHFRAPGGCGFAVWTEAVRPIDA